MAELAEIRENMGRGLGTLKDNLNPLLKTFGPISSQLALEREAACEVTGLQKCGGWSASYGGNCHNPDGGQLGADAVIVQGAQSPKSERLLAVSKDEGLRLNTRLTIYSCFTTNGRWRRSISCRISAA
jgi:hypothetical protein